MPRGKEPAEKCMGGEFAAWQQSKKGQWNSIKVTAQTSGYLVTKKLLTAWREFRKQQ